MWNYVGLIRSGKRLARAREILQELQLEISHFYQRAALSDGIIGLRNGVEAALLITQAAIECRAKPRLPLSRGLISQRKIFNGKRWR